MILVVGVGPGAVATPINLSTMKALMQKLKRFDNQGGTDCQLRFQVQFLFPR